MSNDYLLLEASCEWCRSLLRCCRGSSHSRVIASLSDVDGVYANVYPKFIKDVWTVTNLLSPG